MFVLMTLVDKAEKVAVAPKHVVALRGFDSTSGQTTDVFLDNGGVYHTAHTLYEALDLLRYGMVAAE